MSSMVIACIVFACVFGGTLFGLFLRTVLPEDHLSPDSKDVVKLGIGLIATMSALVLGLLVAATKSSHDTWSSEFTHMSANIILLDRVLPSTGRRLRKPAISSAAQSPPRSGGPGAAPGLRR